MLVNSSAGQVIFGENFMSLSYASFLTWMDGLFNCFSWFVVQAIFHHDSGSVIRSKLHRPIFACFIQSKIPLSFVSSPVLWSEFVCMVFFRKFIPLFAILFWPSDCELWFTINWISNSCEMFTLGVDFLTTSLHAFQAKWCYLCISVLPCRGPWLAPFFITYSGIDIASSICLLYFLLDSL